MKDRVKNILFRLSIFGLLFVVPMVNGCGPQPQQKQYPTQETRKPAFEPQADNMATVEDAQLIHFHVGTGMNHLCVRFVRFKFNGHYYIIKDEHDGIMFHSPDCICQNGNSSSSMFDW